MAKRLFSRASAAIAVLLFACAILALFLAQAAGEAASLKEKNSQQQSMLSALQANHSWLEGKSKETGARLLQSQNDLMEQSKRLSEAQKSISTLSQKLSSSQKDLNQSKADLDAQRAKAQEILASLNSLEGEINESIAWFTANSVLPKNHSWASGMFEKRAVSDCVDGGKLNLACIAYLMENTAFAIHYRTDALGSGGSDHLQAVGETIDLGWGDCEDYSLIFKATLNSLKESVPDSVPVAFAGGGGSDFRVYPRESVPLSQGEGYWYVPNAHGVQLGTLSSLNAYVVCFTRDSNGGHCVLALTEAKISSSAQVGMLEGAHAFEPQKGVYLGNIGTDFGICRSDSCYYEPYVIRLVISDSGLYFFQRGGTGWVGYEEYLGKVSEAKAKLI